jgi:hypothetical protein
LRIFVESGTKPIFTMTLEIGTDVEGEAPLLDVLSGVEAEKHQRLAASG